MVIVVIWLPAIVPAVVVGSLSLVTSVLVFGVPVGTTVMVVLRSGSAVVPVRVLLGLILFVV